MSFAKTGRQYSVKFINKTGNSVYIEDIDYHISFDGDAVQYLETDKVLKSTAFQSLIIAGIFDIVSINDSRIEKNLVRMQSELLAKKEAIKEIDVMPSGTEPEVVIKGHFYDAGGYAKVNRNLSIALAKEKIKVEIKPLNIRRNDLNELEMRQMAALSKSVGKSAIKIDSIIPTMTDISAKSSYRILYTTIEACTVPKQIIDICNQYDEIWVTSDFCKEVLEKYKMRPKILVIPASVNVKLYHEQHEPYVFRPELKSFVFVSVFGWSYRKGYDALLKSYLEAFDGDDDVSLLIVSRFQNMSERSSVIQKEISNYLSMYGGSNPAHIARCGRVIPEYEMPKIYKACNAYVTCSRGEGFNVPIIEASLCGLPVISVNHSGPTMFLTQDNANLVDIDGIEKIQRGTMHVHYWDDQEFPILKSGEFISDFANKMKYVFNNTKETKNKNKILQAKITDAYSCESVGKLAAKRIREIWDNIGEKT